MKSRFQNLKRMAVVLPSLLALAGSSAMAEDAPRELSTAERQAVALAVAYLSEGPGAWWPRLADDAPLRRLGPETAVAALEVRAGPPAGAHWHLQTVPEAAAADTAVFTIELPSGIEETLLLRLRESADGWKIDTVRMSSEMPAGSVAPTRSGVPQGPGEAAPAPKSVVAPSKILPAVLGAGAVLLLIAAIRRGAWLALAGVLLGAGAVALLFLDPSGQAPGAAASATAAAAEPEADLSFLLEFRRAVATADPEALEAARKTLPATGQAARVAQLWEAQQALSALDLNAAESILESLPQPATMPQAERLRARLGFLRRSEVDTALAYERLLEIGVWDDAMLFEAARAFDILGFPARAKRYYEEVQKLGTREAEIYFFQASMAVIDDVPTKAARYFTEGWNLKPLPRDRVISHVILAYLVEEIGALQQLLDLDSPTEPEVKCGGVSSEALSLPAGASASLLGSFLSLEIGAGKLDVPHGCALAPAGVEILDAATWREHRESSVLAALGSQKSSGSFEGDLTRPRMVKEIEQAVEALARRGRWDEVLGITDALGVEVAGIPPSVARQRAEALRRAGRRQEARELLTALAASNIKDKQVDPGTLYQLAELLVADGQYDLALKLMAKAHAQLPREVDPRRIRQVQMEKRLANASAVYESEHFEVFYPYERSLFFAERVAEILEAERKRLKKWIPVSGRSKTEVFLLDFDDFQTGYGGNVEIIGLYDGKIRVPFAQVNTFIPYIVAVLTHELAHAMITEATGDRAPHWLQEGLAQHVEMPQQGINPIAGYQSTGALLSFPMIETVLGSFAASRLVPVAYDESRWVLHFVESRYGVRGIHGLLSAFADGLTTEGALAKVAGKSVADFDREVWDWCLEKAPDLWPSEIVHYDSYDAPILVPDAYEELAGEGEDEGHGDDYEGRD